MAKGSSYGKGGMKGGVVAGPGKQLATPKAPMKGRKR